MGSASLAAARPTARPPVRPPARTVTTIPLQPGGLRGKKELELELLFFIPKELELELNVKELELELNWKKGIDPSPDLEYRF